MKKKVKREMVIELTVCNICEEEITSLPYYKKRIDIVKQLFKTDNFDAHEACINAVVKKAFKQYFPSNQPIKEKV